MLGRLVSCRSGPSMYCKSAIGGCPIMPLRVSYLAYFQLLRIILKNNAEQASIDFDIMYMVVLIFLKCLFSDKLLIKFLWEIAST
jgi:hypothetical protein